MQQTEKVHYLSLGAGVQSSTMALMAAKGEITPMPKFAVFADTQSEPKIVYAWLQFLRETITAFPIYDITKGNLAIDSLVVRVSKKTGNYYAKHSIPAFTLSPTGEKGIMHRECSLDYKIAPIRSFVKKGDKTSYFVQWLGISYDELQRMSDSKDKRIENIYPLIEKVMSRYDCYKWMEQNGYPIPPSSSCVFCPYHSDREWLRMKTDTPEEFQQAVQYEKDYQKAYRKVTKINSVPYLHQSRKPLDSVDFDPTRDQINLFNNDCGGHCGI